MKHRISRRKFIASAAVSMVTPALAGAQPKTGGLLSLFADEPEPASTPQAAWKEAGVIDLSRSPFAKLKTVPVRAVVLKDGFWSQRRKTNVASSIPSMHDELLAHGRMDNFLRLEAKSSAPQKGPVYSDSDIYKWTEAAGFVLQTSDQPHLKSTTDAMIRDVVAAQEPDGYLNTYYVADKKSQRMLYERQEVGHELYNIGHMLQGAIAYYRATGDRTLLEACIRFVDGYLLPNFGPGADKKPIFSGHPEIELALVELYRTTREKRYLELAGYILQGDDRMKYKPQAYVYHFSGIPFTSRMHLEGHAVRAMYACCGAVDYYMETGDQSYWKTLEALWNDL